MSIYVKSIPITGLWGPEDSWRLRFPDSMTLALEVGRLPSIRTRRLYPQEYPGTHCLSGSVDLEHMELSDVTEKILSDTTGDRSRDLLTSSAVP
jgi:hypothetical protein